MVQDRRETLFLGVKTNVARRRGREATFDAFVREIEPRLRRALVAAYGPEAGRDAALDALAWAWSHWERVETMDNPAGYLYRVGQTRAREARQARGVIDHRPLADAAEIRSRSEDVPAMEPGLEPALLALSEQQRVAVVLCHAMQWTHREVAELLDLSPSTVQNHVERGLVKLRRILEVHDDA